MEPLRRVTQKEVAKAAGVARTTVSLALRGAPNIPKVTRDRIAKIAKRLGYMPDPMMSALASYRNRIGPQNYHGKLVWLAETTPHHSWRKLPAFTEYLSGAQECARTHGYSLEVMDITELGLTWERAGAIAYARGVPGLLFCPQPYAEVNLPQFPWEKFSSVTFGYSLSQPALNSVAPAHYRATLRIMRELHKRGCRHVGCTIKPEHDSRMDHNFIAGYLSGCHIVGQPPLPLCSDDLTDGEGHEFVAWIERNRPDAIVTSNHFHLGKLKQLGLKLPRKLLMACPILPSRDEPMMGVLEESHLIGSIAVDLLLSKIQRGERGVPSNPQRILVDGTWNTGRAGHSATLPSIKSDKP